METYEIIRRRLFQDLQPEEAKERDKTVKRFHDLYKQNPSDFPAECREGPYLERMRVCYPVHPDLFDMLASDWATLPQFQRTRGVLRFMANVIYPSWFVAIGGSAAPFQRTSPAATCLRRSWIVRSRATIASPSAWTHLSVALGKSGLLHVLHGRLFSWPLPLMPGHPTLG
jgi:hypothetical protein